MGPFLSRPLAELLCSLSSFYEVSATQDDPGVHLITSITREMERMKEAVRGYCFMTLSIRSAVLAALVLTVL